MNILYSRIPTVNEDESVFQSPRQPNPVEIERVNPCSSVMTYNTHALTTYSWVA